MFKKCRFLNTSPVAAIPSTLVIPAPHLVILAQADIQQDEMHFVYTHLRRYDGMDASQHPAERLVQQRFFQFVEHDEFAKLRKFEPL